jgi:predicted ribosome quality control (RQC) complex YloA/Tae2 family protein
MAFDGITLNAVVKELQILKGAKVNSINQPDKNSIVISVYNGNNFAINIDTSANNYRIHLTTHSRKNPLNALNFCMCLRKQLNRAKIDSIYMKDLERICYIKFSTYNEMNDLVNKTLIIELMGKYSNIILVNENFKIIDALKKFDNFDVLKKPEKSRGIMPGREYIEPVDEKYNFKKTSENEFVEIIEKSSYKTLESAIPNLFTGISKLFVQNIINTLELTNTISRKSLKNIYEYINEIIDCSNSSNLKLIINKNNYSVGIEERENNKNSATEFNEKENNDLTINKDNYSCEEDENILKINFELDDFYYNKIEKELFTNYRNVLLKILENTLDKLTKKLYNINEKVEFCKKKDDYKIYGELLLANIYRLKNVNTIQNENASQIKNEDTSENLSQIKEKNEKTLEVQVENYYDNNKKINIPINPKISISKNAENYFKKYDKMKRTLDVVNKQKEQTNKELNYLSTIIDEIDTCTTISDINEVYEEISENILFNEVSNHKRYKAGKIKKEDTQMLLNYLKFKVDDYDVLVGKNNKQNDYITLHVANDTDYWFHTKDIHGSHLILRCNGVTPKLETIKKCAEIAAYHSKAKFSSHVPVDYTQIKNVKKPRGAVPGYVIYKNNKTIYVTPQI